MNILFVCKHNRFRSKVAEALFKKYNNKDSVKSAGIFLDLMRPYIAKTVLDVLKEQGIEKIDQKPRKLNEFDLKWAEKIIIVTNNVNKDLFKNRDVEVWEIEDCSEYDLDNIRKIVKEIDKKIKEYL